MSQLQYQSEDNRMQTETKNKETSILNAYMLFPPFPSFSAPFEMTLKNQNLSSVL